MSAAPPTVFVVDDDSSVRTALKRVLESEGFEVRAYPSADAFLAQSGDVHPACVVSDLAMPDRDGLQLQNALAGSERPLPIVFVSGQGTIPSTVEAMKNGAVDFLTKPVCSTDLVRAVTSAIEKDRSAGADLEVVSTIRRRVSTLTPREREVLGHVIGGRLNKQSAADLGIAEKTIKVHRARVMEKMGASSVAELARLCERARIQPQAASADH
jgi:FixJ family two-component response regulator